MRVPCAARKPTRSESCGTRCARRLDGIKFKRQVPIGRYIADFMCFECKLIVEVDGGQHAEQTDYDAARTSWLETQGYRVVRRWNREVLLNIEGAAEEIWQIAQERKPVPAAKA